MNHETGLVSQTDNTVAALQGAPGAWDLALEAGRARH